MSSFGNLFAMKNQAQGGTGLAGIPTWKLLAASALSNIGKPGKGINPIQLIMAQRDAQQEQDQLFAQQQLFGQLSQMSQPRNLAQQAFSPSTNDMVQTALTAGMPEVALKLSGADKILNPLKPQAPIKGSPGDVFFDPVTNQELFSVPAAPKEDKISGKMQEYLDLYGDPIKARQAWLQDRQRELSGGVNAAPSGYQWMPDGSLKPIKGGPADIGQKGLPQKYKDQATALRQLTGTISEYKNLLAEVGTEFWDDQKAAKLQSLETQMTFGIKGLEQTGALDKGSVEVMSGMIPDATGITANLLDMTGLKKGTNRALSKVSELEQYVNRAGQAIETSYRGENGLDVSVQKTNDRPAGAPQDAQQAPDGNWYSPDPARPGKYLKW